jgi:uncharacterized membrane protein YkoI
MKRRYLKLFGLVLIIGLTYAAGYAGKSPKTTLPAAVKEAITKLYTQAVVEEVEVEEEGVKVYEIELKHNGRELELTIAADGTILEVESEVVMENLPNAVQAAIIKAAAGAKIEEVKEEVTYWVVRLQKLQKPETTYEAELLRDGKEIEIEIAANGSILEQKAQDHDDDDCDDDDDDEELSIDQVPAVVKATILKQALGGTVKEIERETKDGKTSYEAEIIVNAKEYELEIAADGTLISKEAEDDDD